MPLDSSSPFPPSYNEVVNDTADDNELWGPTILVLADLSVHAESVDEAPLYRLNRAVACITASTKQVEFERVERTVKTSTDEPVIKLRSRHIYNLKYLRKMAPQDMPCAYIETVSRRTTGSVGLRKSLFRSHWKVLPLDVSRKTCIPTFVKDAAPLFHIQQSKDRTEWTDVNGDAVAIEEVSDGQHKLIITASLHRNFVDALVALWCCRIWQHSAEHAIPIHEGMEGGKFSRLNDHQLFDANGNSTQEVEIRQGSPNWRCYHEGRDILIPLVIVAMLMFEYCLNES
jgi:hypothetical protein